jgi:hypothetical protein
MFVAAAAASAVFLTFFSFHFNTLHLFHLFLRSRNNFYSSKCKKSGLRIIPSRSCSHSFILDRQSFVSLSSCMLSPSRLCLHVSFYFTQMPALCRLARTHPASSLYWEWSKKEKKEEKANEINIFTHAGEEHKSNEERKKIILYEKKCSFRLRAYKKKKYTRERRAIIMCNFFSRDTTIIHP